MCFLWCVALVSGGWDEWVTAACTSVHSRGTSPGMLGKMPLAELPRGSNNYQVCVCVKDEEGVIQAWLVMALSVHSF